MEDEEFKLGFIRQIVNDPSFKQGTSQYRDQIINQMLSFGVPRMTIDRVISEGQTQLPPWPQGCVVEDTSKYGKPDDVLEECEKDEETGEVIDPISLEVIPENKLIRTRCNGQLRCYNIDTLKKLLENKLEDPFTRAPVSREFLNEVNRRIAKTGKGNVSVRNQEDSHARRERLNKKIEEINQILQADPELRRELDEQIKNLYLSADNLVKFMIANPEKKIQISDGYEGLEDMIKNIEDSIEAYRVARSPPGSPRHSPPRSPQFSPRPYSREDHLRIQALLTKATSLSALLIQLSTSIRQGQTSLRFGENFNLISDSLNRLNDILNQLQRADRDMAQGRINLNFNLHIIERELNVIEEQVRRITNVPEIRPGQLSPGLQRDMQIEELTRRARIIYNNLVELSSDLGHLSQERLVNYESILQRMPGLIEIAERTVSDINSLRGGVNISLASIENNLTDLENEYILIRNRIPNRSRIPNIPGQLSPRPSSSPRFSDSSDEEEESFIERQANDLQNRLNNLEERIGETLEGRNRPQNIQTVEDLRSMRIIIMNLIARIGNNMYNPGFGFEIDELTEDVMRLESLYQRLIQASPIHIQPRVISPLPEPNLNLKPSASIFSGKSIALAGYNERHPRVIAAVQRIKDLIFNINQFLYGQFLGSITQKSKAYLEAAINDLNLQLSELSKPILPERLQNIENNLRFYENTLDEYTALATKNK